MLPNKKATLSNKITGANAGGPRQFPIWARWAARVAQFRRWATYTMRGRMLIPVAVILAIVSFGWAVLRKPAHGTKRTRAVWNVSTNFAGVRYTSVLVTNEGSIPVNLDFYKVDMLLGRPVFKRFSPAVQIPPSGGTSVEIPAALASSRERIFFGLSEHTFRNSLSRLCGKIPSARLKQALPKSWLTTEGFAALALS